MKAVYRGIEMEGSPKEVFLLMRLMGSFDKCAALQTPVPNLQLKQHRLNPVRPHCHLGYSKYDGEKGGRTFYSFEVQA